MARTNGPIQVWHRTDTIPSDAEGGYAGGDSTAAAIGTVGAQASQAYTFVDNIQASAVSLPPGSEATATVTGALPIKTVNFGIPQGRDGRDGVGAAEGAALVGQAQEARTAAQVAQAAAESAKAAAFAEPDSVVSQLAADAVTQTHATLASSFQRRDHLSGLLPWRIAYNARASTKARVVVLGSDEGQGASTRANRWTEQLQTRLRAGATGGQWLSAAASAPGINSGGLTTTGTTEVAGGQNGWGGRMLLMRGGSTAATPSLTMTGFTVWYQQNNFFSCDAEVLVDGVKVADIDGTDPFTPARQVTFTTTNAAHVVTIRSTGGASAAFELNAIHVHRGDVTTGVEVIEGARRGAWLRSITSSEWDKSHNPVLTALDPSLVIVYAGDQDWLDDATAFFEGDVAGIPAKIDALVSRLHSVLLVLPPRPTPAAGSTLDPARYAYIRGLMASAAAAHPDRVAFFDASEHFPRLQVDGATSQGLFVEAQRPRTLSDAGHAWLASMIAALLS